MLQKVKLFSHENKNVVSVIVKYEDTYSAPHINTNTIHTQTLTHTQTNFTLFFNFY